MGTEGAKFEGHFFERRIAPAGPAFGASGLRVDAGHPHIGVEAPTPAHHSTTTSTCALPAVNDSTTIKPGCEVCSALHLLLRRAGGMKHRLLALPAAAGICAVVLSTNAVLILVALPAWSMLVE